MSPTSQSPFPSAAIDWLVPGSREHVLALGRNCAPLLPHLAATGHHLTANDPDPAGVRAMLGRAPAALPTVSEAIRMPFVPGAFDTVLINQSLHTLDLPRALPEIARVLIDGGTLAVSYTVRDDSVPWVKRLAALMQSIDSEAMTGDYGGDSVAELARSPFFPDLERKNFRLWVPIARVGLLEMVARRFPDLAEDRRADLLADVGRLYEASARVPEPLLLPYQVACWRARVDHSEFSTPIRLPDRGLSISL
ncbi:class I SAM-dependent methyltransferase [Nigerium massiliense]|uniref:class I SAM-dependent methyltransferase n=1 Tax=Nigerium massiliense TaxID=1522317 RepID=UPI0009E2B7FD|nr:class I SAM-dependent methyltransferase [Nigerium massiliense]